MSTKKRGNPNIAKLSPWKKGVSGNPGGRPAVPEDVKEALRAASPQAVATLVGIMLNGKSEDTRVKAASIILDRAYGKAVAAVDVRVTDTATAHLQILEEIRARRQERLAASGQVVDVTPVHTQRADEKQPIDTNKNGPLDDFT